MRYTVVLTDQLDGQIHVSVPGLPNCTVEAATRKEALQKIHKTISTIVSRSEIIQLDVPTEPKSDDLHLETPWEWFGRFEDNPTWEMVFDKVEEQKAGTGEI